MYCRNYTGPVSHVLCREAYSVFLPGRVHYRRFHCKQYMQIFLLLTHGQIKDKANQIMHYKLVLSVCSLQLLSIQLFYQPIHQHQHRQLWVLI